MVLITGKLYDRLKFIAQVLLPALGSLYFALAGIWNLPSAEEVVGTILVVDTFLGTILQLSSTAYSKSDARFDGSIEVLEEEDGVQNFAMQIPNDAGKIMDSKELVLKVNKPESKPRRRR